MGSEMCIRDRGRVAFGVRQGSNLARNTSRVGWYSRYARSSEIILEVDSKRDGRVYESHVGVSLGLVGSR